jgi:ribosome-associated protein
VKVWRENVTVSDSISQSAREVSIRDESIRLGQLLKLANLVSSGSDARRLISAEEVLVNGEIETRRGRMLRSGDLVMVGGKAIRVSQQGTETVKK